jgi:hypothetical protein
MGGISLRMMPLVDRVLDSGGAEAREPAGTVRAVQQAVDDRTWAWASEIGSACCSRRLRRPGVKPTPSARPFSLAGRSLLVIQMPTTSTKGMNQRPCQRVQGIFSQRPETRDQGEAIQQPPAGRYEIIAEDLCSVVRAALPFADSVTFRRPGQIFARRAGVNRSAPAPKPPLDHELLLSNAAIVAAALEIRINLQTFTRRCRLAGEVEFPDSTHICRSS